MNREEYNQAREKTEEYLKRLQNPHCQEMGFIVDYCADETEDYCPHTCSFAKEERERRKRG